MANVSRRQFFMLGTAASFAALGLAGCTESSKGGAVVIGDLKDGTFTGKSPVHDAHVDGDGYGIITITVEGGEIVDAKFEAFLPDGTPKDENYGKDGAFYSKAQMAAKSVDSYAKALVKAGSIDEVDAISGATYMYDQFNEAAIDALKQASK